MRGGAAGTALAEGLLDGLDEWSSAAGAFAEGEPVGRLCVAEAEVGADGDGEPCRVPAVVVPDTWSVPLAEERPDGRADRLPRVATSAVTRAAVTATRCLYQGFREAGRDASSCSRDKPGRVFNCRGFCLGILVDAA